MTLAASIRLTVPLVLAAACASCGEPAIDHHGVDQGSTEQSFVGQLLLPAGVGNRGVEVLALVERPGSEPHTEWSRFDEQGRFSHTFQGSLVSVKVTSAIGLAAVQFDSEDLPDANPSGQIDLGRINLRDQLTRHRQVVRAADGAPPGEVRVGMWSGKPPVGVDLGSIQFPPVTLGDELEWLLPPEAESIYILVQRPSATAPATQWRSGHERLFGPFTAESFPSELIMD